MAQRQSDLTKTTAAKKDASKNASSESSSLETMDKKVGGNPLREEAHLYHDTEQGMPTDGMTEQRTFKTSNDFIDDLDDEEEISAELVQAGVDSAADSTADDDEDEEDELEAPGLDREFRLGKAATESNFNDDGELEEEDDDDFEDLPRREALKADHDF